MGCGSSRLEPEEAPGPLPVRPACRQNRTGNRRRRRNRAVRSRKDSIVSTTDLLRSQADDISEVGSSTASPRKHPLHAEVEKKRALVVAAAKKGKLGFGEGEKMVVVAEEEDEDAFPGSPSFRFYFQDSPIDGILDKLNSEENSQEGDDSFVSVNSNEGSENKLTNKVKGKRMSSLKKGPNAVYNLLSARGCYNHNHHHHHGHSALARVAPHPSDEKDA